MNPAPDKSVDWMRQHSSVSGTQSWIRPVSVGQENWLPEPTNQTQDDSQSPWFQDREGKVPDSRLPILKLPEIQEEVLIT